MRVDDGPKHAADFRACEEVSIMDGFETRRPESELSLLQLLMTGIAMLLLVYGMALLVVIEFTSRHLIANPTAWLLRHLGLVRRN